MRRTIAASDNPAVLGGVRAKNNGRYNGNGRHWETPPEVFAPLHQEFEFTLDPCATPETAKCPMFYTEADNGLEQSWAGHRVFMNPPYGREVYAWTRKARTEQAAGALVVGLVPASTDLAWWHEDVVGFADVRYIRGSLLSQLTASEQRGPDHGDCKRDLGNLRSYRMDLFPHFDKAQRSNRMVYLALAIHPLLYRRPALYSCHCDQ